MRKGNVRRLASVLLSAVIATTSVPFAAFAEEPPAEQVTEQATEKQTEKQSEPAVVETPQATEPATEAKQESPEAPAPEEPATEAKQEPTEAPTPEEPATEAKQESDAKQEAESKESETGEATKPASDDEKPSEDESKQEEPETSAEATKVKAGDYDTITLTIQGQSDPIELNLNAPAKALIDALVEATDPNYGDMSDVEGDLVDSENYRINVDGEDDSVEDVIGTIAAEDDGKMVFVLYEPTKEVARYELTYDVETDEFTGKKVTPTKYKMTYDANGGELENEEAVSYRAANEKISYFDNGAWHETKEFAGWFTAANGGSEVTEDSVLTADTTVYAHWDDMSRITLNLDMNYIEEGSTESDVYPYTVTLGDGATTDVTLPRYDDREGYTLKGWSESKTSSDCGWTYSLSSDDDQKTFYAVWKEGTLPLITYDYDRDDYVIEVKQTTVGYYEADDDGTAEPLIEEYGDEIFLGWYDEDGNLVPDGTEVTSDIYLIAHWAIPITIRFMPDPGYFDDENDETAEAYTDFPLSEYLQELPTPQNDTQEFKGWYTLPSGGDEVDLDYVIDGEEYEDVDEFLVYAHYKAAPVTLHFDANGGQLTNADDATRTTEVGEPLGNLPEATMDEKDLVGWFTSATGGTKVTATTAAPESETTYYAHWETKKYTVTFDGNGGNVYGSTTATVESGASVTSFPEAKRDGYVFTGWFTQTTGGDEITTTTAITKDQTAYAQWVEDKKTVTFDANGGTCSETTREVSTRTSVGELPEPKREGYDFQGWFTQAEGGDPVFETYVVNDDVTFYAQWKESPKQLTSVTFNKHELNVNYGDSIGEDVLDFTWEALDAADKDDFFYRSSNTDVISISGSRTIVTVGGGQATVTVSSADGSVHDDCLITVTKPQVLVTELAYKFPTQTITAGDPVNLEITWNPPNAENAVFEMTSSHPNLTYPENTEEGWTNYWGTDAKTMTEPVTVTFTVSTTDGTKSATKTIIVNPKETLEPETEIIYRKVTFMETGDSTIAPVTVKDGQSVSLPTPTREGYSFDGWHLANGTKIEGSSFVPESDVILYGRWTEIPPDPTPEYVATFEPNYEGSPAAEQITRKEGEALGTLPTAPQRDGYSFEGWFTNATGGTPVSSSTTLSKDETYYAHWTEDSTGRKYDLNLNPNGGYVTVGGNKTGETQKIEDGLTGGGTDNNDVSRFAPERENYEFIGWFSSPNNTDAIYDENGLFVAGNAWDSDGKYLGNSDMTAYAQWRALPEQKTLTYAPRGGTIDGQASLQEKYEKGTVVTELKTPERDEYDFLGWFTKATGGEQVTSVTMNDDVTIYAQWQKKDQPPTPPKEHTVTFDAQGGTPCEPVTAPDGTEVELPETTRDGHDFLGWFTDANGGTKLTKIVMDGDKTVYAHWKETPDEPTTYQVKFTDGDETTTVEVEVNKTLTTFPTPAEKAGSEFLGWFTERDGGTKVTYYKATADAEFFAHWKEIVPEPTAQYTLTFDSQGGSEIDPVTADKGTRIELPGEYVPTKEGYSFKGWYTTPTGTARVTAVTLKADVTVYAHWKENEKPETTYVVVLEPRNGEDAKVETIDAGTTFTAFPTPVRTGYDFVGWFTEKSGGSQVTSFAGDAGTRTTFYGHWKKAETPSGNLVTKLELNYHNLTVQAGKKLGLSYDYSPKGATNAQFRFTSSDASVVDTDGTTLKPTGKVGITTITVSTVDGTVSDSCVVKVVAASKSNGGNGTYKGSSGSSGSNGSNGSSGTNGTNGTNGTSGNGGSGGTGSTGASGTSGSGASGTTAEVGRYQLTIIKGEDKKNAAVNATVALEALVKKLGYEAASYKLKTADGTTTDLAGTTTMKELDGKASNGEVLIIAYDAEGKLIGSAKVTKTAIGEFTVNLSKDEDQKLDATPFKAPEGKEEPQKSQVQTGDDLNVGLLVGIGIAVAALAAIGIFLALSDKKKRTAKTSGSSNETK